MTPHQIKLVQNSFAQVAPIATIAADLFYGRLFEIAPMVRRMFPQDMAEQKKKLMTMLGMVVSGLTKLDALVPAVRALGKRHAAYDVHEEHFAPVGSALVGPRAIMHEARRHRKLFGGGMRQAGILAAAAVVYSLPFIVIQTVGRYRFPSLWISALLAGHAVTVIVRRGQKYQCKAPLLVLFTAYFLET